MHKQILFYSKNYQVGYCPETKSLSQPQTKEFSKSEFLKNTALCIIFAGLCWFLVFFGIVLSITENILYGIIPTVLICLLVIKFLKVKTHFEFMLKCLWNIFFVQCFGVGLLFLALVAGFSGNYLFPELWICGYLLLFIVIGILLTAKIRIKIPENSEYINNAQNKKVLTEILKSSRKNYILVRIVGVVALFIVPCISFILHGNFIYEYIALSVVVAIFQKNFYYLSLINEIAEKYDISLKSKDVIAENDAQAEKQINEEKEITLQVETEIKNEIDTGNKTNLETNTQINTEEN